MLIITGKVDLVCQVDFRFELHILKEKINEYRQLRKCGLPQILGSSFEINFIRNSYE